VRFNNNGVIRRGGSFRLPVRDKMPEATTSRPTIRREPSKVRRRSTTQSIDHTFEVLVLNGKMSMLAPEALMGHQGKKSDANITKLIMIPR